MKSIVEEASSIVKAIEKGWIRAGKPQEFSVKVFEEPQKNFFGLTVKSAKIALFFKHEESTHAKKSASPKEHKETVKEKVTHSAQAQQKHAHHQPQQQKPKQEKQEKAAPQSQPKPMPERLVWNDDLIKATKTWTADCLSLLGLSHISFSTNHTGNLLRLEFDAPLTQEKDKERYLFKSFAHLILEHLSQQFKKNVKSLKITISTLQPSFHDSL